MFDNQITYIDVIVPLPLQANFTYAVPEHLVQSVVVGGRVVVQFGARKYYSALVVKIHHEQPEQEAKPIDSIVDVHPVVTENQLKFWNWLADYYMCTVGEVMKAGLPSGLKLESQTSLTVSEQWLNRTCQSLSNEEIMYCEFVEQQGCVTIQQINKQANKKNAFPQIQRLLEKGALLVEEKLSGSYKKKVKSMIRLSETYRDEASHRTALSLMSRSPKQTDLFLKLLGELIDSNDSAIDKQDFLQKNGFSAAILRALKDKGIVELFDEDVDRIKYAEETKGLNELNLEQDRAITEIRAGFAKNQVQLLHGVTASGKTEVYIHLIDELLTQGKQVLYLLPEIALTSQIVLRLSAVFGDKVCLYHSKFNDGERVEIWQRVLDFQNREQKGQLIVGARSALLMPFSNLGLVIVDEEHEVGFKQFDPAPRYHARDASIVYAHMFGAQVLLGSATPSFESYYNVQSKKYGLVEMKNRHFDVELPEIKIADFVRARKRKLMHGHFTPELFETMEEALKKGEQIILFQNRRGYSPFVQCNSCGHIPKCKNCDVSLTYHRSGSSLVCHYCGFISALPNPCPSCGGGPVESKGFGTEKIEEELNLMFPEYNIARMDLDTTRAKYGYDRIIDDFSKQKTQVLVGTQMVAKGLDFENVSVVGILNADNLLNYPDFRSYERAFQLILQVSGRAGRKRSRGQVIIQTAQPDHPVLADVIDGNFQNTFNRQIDERKMFHYPPWFRLVYITIRHKEYQKAYQASQALATLLRKVFGGRVLGPEPPLISRLQNSYQFMVRLKFEKRANLKDVRIHITRAIDHVHSIDNNSSVRFILDVDPV